MKGIRWTFMPSSIRSLSSCASVSLYPTVAWTLVCSVQTGREQSRAALAQVEGQKLKGLLQGITKVILRP